MPELSIPVSGPGELRLTWEFVPTEVPVPEPEPQPEGKVMYGWYQDGNDVADGQAVEADLGKKFACYRYFASSWGLPSENAKKAGKGRLLLWSVKADTWSSVAKHEAWVPIMEAWAEHAEPVIVIFYHEPHDNLGTGRTADQYKAVYQAMSVAREAVQANNVLLGYCGTRSKVVENDPLWPGPVVDVLCHDSYNRVSGIADRTFADSWRSVLAVCEEVQRPLIIGEFGCLPSTHPDWGFDYDRNQWFRDAAAWIKSDELAKKWLKGFCYFHSRGYDRWKFTPDGEGEQGWIDAFVNDPYFTSTPFVV